jgi:hypothetical protein
MRNFSAPTDKEEKMRDINHVVVSTNTEAALSFLTPSRYAGDSYPPPNVIVQWASAGPWVLAWGHRAACQRGPVEREPFLQLGSPITSKKPLGVWFRRRGELRLLPKPETLFNSLDTPVLQTIR